MSIRNKCQQLWIKAATGEDITISFPTKGERERARFALYDACRKSTDQELLAARAIVEIRKSQDGLSLTLALRSKNPFHSNLESALGEVLGESVIGGGESEVDASLRRLREKLEASPEPRPATPYFDRGED